MKKSVIILIVISVIICVIYIILGIVLLYYSNKNAVNTPTISETVATPAQNTETKLSDIITGFWYDTQIAKNNAGVDYEKINVIMIKTENNNIIMEGQQFPSNKISVPIKSMSDNTIVLSVPSGTPEPKIIYNPNEKTVLLNGFGNTSLKFQKVVSNPITNENIKKFNGIWIKNAIEIEFLIINDKILKQTIKNNMISFSYSMINIVDNKTIELTGNEKLKFTLQDDNTINVSIDGNNILDTYKRK